MKKIALMILTGLCLVSCGQKEESTAGSEITSTVVSVQETGSSAVESSLTETATAAGMVNPINQVESSADFAKIGIKLEIPSHDTRYKDEQYFIIDGKVAEINFYDNITESSAFVRAAGEDLGDLSGVYYNFDETQNKAWTVVTDFGEPIDILVQVLIDGSDIPGALASWNCQGMNYYLWEDNGKNFRDSVGKLAMEIAKASLK